MTNVWLIGRDVSVSAVAPAPLKASAFRDVVQGAAAAEMTQRPCEQELSVRASHQRSFQYLHHEKHEFLRKPLTKYEKDGTFYQFQQDGISGAHEA